jgi:hypothetical protein
MSRKRAFVKRERSAGPSWNERQLRWARRGTIAGIIGAIPALFFLLDRFFLSSAPASVPAPSHSASASPYRPKCVTGSICLWPEMKFGGTVWVWTPGVDKDTVLPSYLKDHVGSFEARARACFVNAEEFAGIGAEKMRSAKVGDWSERYTDATRFGRVMDSIHAVC